MSLNFKDLIQKNELEITSLEKEVSKLKVSLDELFQKKREYFLIETNSSKNVQFGFVFSSLFLIIALYIYFFNSVIEPPITLIKVLGSIFGFCLLFCFISIPLIALFSPLYDFIKQKQKIKELKKNNFSLDDLSINENDIRINTNKIDVINKRISNKRQEFEVLKINELAHKLNETYDLIKSKINELNNYSNQYLEKELLLYVEKYDFLMQSEFFDALHHQTQKKFKNYRENIDDYLIKGFKSYDFEDNIRTNQTIDSINSKIKKKIDEIISKIKIEVTNDPYWTEDKQAVIKNIKTRLKNDLEYSAYFETLQYDNESLETHIDNYFNKSNYAQSTNLITTKHDEYSVSFNTEDVKELQLDEIFSEKAKKLEQKKLEKESLKSKNKGTKIDYIESAELKQKIGEGGEYFVLKLEKNKLIKKGKQDLADKVSRVYDDFGDGLGYDILSYDENGNEKYIEVKTTIQSLKTDFYMSDNEFNKAKSMKNYFIYRVFEFDIETERGNYIEINTQVNLDKYFIVKPISYKFTPKIK